MDTNSDILNEQILSNYKKTIELKDSIIMNLNKQIELMKNTKTNDSIITILQSELNNREKYIELLIKKNNLLVEENDLLKNNLLKNSISMLNNYNEENDSYEEDEYIQEDNSVKNEYIAFLVNNFKSYNFERMINYTQQYIDEEQEEDDMNFNSYNEFIEFNKNEYEGFNENKKKFLSQLSSKITNGKISIGSNVYFNIWKANVFYINKNKKICINHPR